MDTQRNKRPVDLLETDPLTTSSDAKRTKMSESDNTVKAQTRLNRDFIKFYKEQGFFDDEEWIEFVKSLHIELPTTFRVTNHNNHLQPIYPGYTSRDILIRILKEKFHNNDALKYKTKYELEKLNHLLQSEAIPSDSDASHEFHVDIQPPQPISWYPFDLAWHFAESKKQLRSSRAMRHLKHFLNVESEIGNISRQESVSMVPPLLLDVHKDHTVLDMCASPGSKSSQILEVLNAYNSEGLLIANDVDIVRCYLLTHKLQRIGSKNLLVTNSEAQNFPSIKVEKNGHIEELRFDRILCDVPCSGDGTIRKNPLAGLRWDYNYKKLHGLQLDISRRAAQLLKVDGIMVYSTCSLSPIENEAVVAQLLIDGNGSLELVDVSEKLPSLVRRPGVSKWKVSESYSKVYESYNQVEQDSKLTESMFPPSKDVNLERCLRIYPHLQDAGGFFVAVIKKVSEFPYVKEERQEEPSSEVSETKEDTKETGEAEESDVTGEVKKKKGRVFSEDSFYAIPPSVQESIIKDVSNAYGIPTDCDVFKHLLIRTSKSTSEITDPSHINGIYTCSSLIFNIVTNNPTGVNIINSGVKMLDNDAKKNRKVEISCEWRISNDSLSFLLPYITKRIVKITMNDFIKFIECPSNQPPFFADFEPNTQAQLQNMEGGIGGCVFIVDTGFTPKEFTLSIDPDTNIAVDGNWSDIESLSYKELLQHKHIVFLGWKGGTSASHNIDKLLLSSYRNLYLSEEYNYKVDFTPKPVNEEEKLKSIEKSKQRKLEEQLKKQEKKNERAELRRKRREEARRNKQENSEVAP